MGEIADMMIDGTMCQVCGEFLGDPQGYPITCDGCKSRGDDPNEFQQDVNAKDPKTVECPHQHCERKFRSRHAAAQHWVDKHE